MIKQQLSLSSLEITEKTSELFNLTDEEENQPGFY
jgi:hypothetical protein